VNSVAMMSLEYFCRQHLRWPGLPLFTTIIPGEPAGDGLRGIGPQTSRCTTEAAKRHHSPRTRSNAALKACALFSSATHSSSDISGSNTSIIPLWPTTLGKDKVTPNLF
jgi:hypothetical protein